MQVQRERARVLGASRFLYVFSELMAGGMLDTLGPTPLEKAATGIARSAPWWLPTSSGGIGKPVNVEFGFARSAFGRSPRRAT